MTTIFKGSGSSLTHAISAASASALGAVRVAKQAMSVDTLGSCEVAIVTTSDKQVPIGKLVYGEEGTVAKAITAAGLPTVIRPIHQNIGRQTNGSVHLLWTVTNEKTVPIATILSATAGSVAQALTSSGVSGKTDPRIMHADVANDTTGSVTVVFAVSSDPRVKF